jgi:hypothetical protein
MIERAIGYRRWRGARPRKLSSVRLKYGQHLLSCPHCELLGSDSTTMRCIKGAAWYAALCVALDYRMPASIAGDRRLTGLYLARIDFSRHALRCKKPDVSCEWCLELWSRVVVLQQPGE